jgi:L-ornithine N5-oxygenase
MVCVGFGPASLAIAIALADTYSKSSGPLPKVLFIERQEEFAWHSGMQIPSAKMQISFLKDLATPRDPTSPYTFINYLHSKGRLNQFINLGTFLPTRLEYEDYMRWCADHFAAAVKYGKEVICVEPNRRGLSQEKIRAFRVLWRDVNGLDDESVLARHVVVAAGGEPHIPEEFKPFTGMYVGYCIGHST